MDKQLGKISSVRFGGGGYQDAQFGIWFYFEMKGSACGTGQGVWKGKPSSGAKWTMESKLKTMGEIMLYIEELMKKAKVADINDLVGVPVELSFENMRLSEWRILEEVL